MSRNRKVSGLQTENLADEIRAELRSILRQLDDLRRPIERFSPNPDPPAGQPPFYVIFDNSPHHRIPGLRVEVKTLVLPDERILDAVLSLAKSIWHLKDRLHQYVRQHRTAEDIEAHAKACHALLVCADLANWKKHGRSANVSGHSPCVTTVSFDTSQSGVIEFFYDGARKEKTLLVTNPVPIPFTVPVLTWGSNVVLGDAVSMLAQAFEHWVPLVQRIGVLKDGANPECTDLARRLFVGQGCV